MAGQLLWKHPERLRVRLGLALLVVVGCAFLFALSSPPTSQANLAPQEPAGIRKNSKSEFVPGEVLVRYRSESIARQETRLTGEVMLKVEGREIPVRLERFDGSDIVPGLRLAHVPAQDTMAAIRALRMQPNVVYAEPNYLLYADLDPNDPRFTSGELYGLAKIGAPSAWNTTTGNSGVVVGVIDEGIDRVHQDLQANIWINPGDNTVDGMDNDGNGFIDDVNGYNFVTNSGNITADFHGTHVGGTIGAVGNNATGVVGVNWNVRLMSLKFLGGAGSGSTSDAIRACDYAKKMRELWVSSGGAQGANLRVLNNSYGGGGFSQSFLDAINELDQSGIIFVASAGNVSAGASEPNNEIVPHYPSSYVAPNVIGVANTDSADALSGSSHYGLTTIHLGAPGQGILSTTPGNNYGFSSGTSMATPHVSGAAALLLAQNPNLSVQQLKSLLIFNGDSVAALLNKTVTGRRLNVFNSFQAVAENDTTPPGTVTGFQVNTQTGRSINLGWTASGDDGAAGQASLYQLTFTDATTSAVIPLMNVLPALSGSPQSVAVKLPYRHTSGTITLREFDNVGNEGTPAVIAVSVRLSIGDPYITSVGSPAALSTGGTPLVLIGDDKLRLNHSLPFAFPFFGENFSTVHISTNGNLFFSTPPTRPGGDADDVPGSVVGLTKFKMVSGLWDDLRTDRTAGDDVYVTADASHIIFRWQGVTFGDGTTATEFPVNFEIELLPDGTIHTRYGNGNTNLFPVVGIGAAEPDAYWIPSHTSEQAPISLTNAQQVTFAPRGASTLTVASANPASGVNIKVTPLDNAAAGNGTTQFARTYDIGQVVNLTAPATAGGNNFQKWQRDGVDWATTAQATVTVDAPHTMTAVYATPRTLSVASSNPNSGVNITVTPDLTSAGDGSTPFARTYHDGTVVNLTATATASGNNFLKWQRDGADFLNNTMLATSVTMGAPHTMTAIYVATPTLTVSSSNPSSGVNITVTPTDNGGNGTTPFARTYNQGTMVTLTAPATSGFGTNFVAWHRDNMFFSSNPEISITIGAANSSVIAFYATPQTLTIASRRPDSGVAITVSLSDLAGASDGVTPFTRTYNEGSTVNLTAPADAGGNPFVRWELNGVPHSTLPATSVTVAPNQTMTAVYLNRVQFTALQFPVNEADGTATLTLSRTGSTAAPASINYFTIDDVATQKGDYIISSGTVNFGVGETTKSFKVLIVDDVYQESAEIFRVMLASPVGTTGAGNMAEVQILDNDVAPAPNPLDNADARFFVRQHYLDFLNRQPDDNGLNFWSGQITACGADQACVQSKQVDVSAAFFLSIEFQETGYLVERLYKAAYGDFIGISNYNGIHQLPVPMVDYENFSADSQRISQGLVVGPPGWQQVLENNKQNFTAAFVERVRFTDAFPLSVSPTQFVDTLNSNAGLVLSASERQQLIDDLSLGAKTRAQVLRAVAEDQDLREAEKSRAFVLMQYFGYLRRGPNEAPDSNFTGYDFWLTKLNQFNGNYIDAQMVKAFIDSIEYRRRFAP